MRLLHPLVEIRIVVPRRLYELLKKAERELGVRKEDIIVRALLKVVDELERGGGVL